MIYRLFFLVLIFNSQALIFCRDSSGAGPYTKFAKLRTFFSNRTNPGNYHRCTYKPGTYLYDHSKFTEVLSRLEGRGNELVWHDGEAIPYTEFLRRHKIAFSDDHLYNMQYLLERVRIHRKAYFDQAQLSSRERRLVANTPLDTRLKPLLSKVSPEYDYLFYYETLVMKKKV
jgi:hypothetical protein